MTLRSLVYSVYERRLTGKLAGKPVPQHVGVMCDGNRRWAREMGFVDPNDGHRVGAARIKELLAWCDQAGIEHVTLYLLATDNLRRPGRRARPAAEDHRGPGDRAGRGRQPVAAAHGRRARRAARRAPRRRSRRPRRRPATARSASRSTWRSGTAAGARSPTRSARCCTSTRRPAGTIEELAEILDVEHIAEHLYTRGQPDPDLVIRTSGEQRLSGFLLWQSAHSEFYFRDANWPDFRRVDFLRALRSYASRQRRYGA